MALDASPEIRRGLYRNLYGIRSDECDLCTGITPMVRTGNNRRNDFRTYRQLLAAKIKHKLEVLLSDHSTIADRQPAGCSATKITP